MKDGARVHLEFGFAPEVERDLMKKGHKLSRAIPASFGGYQAILFDATNKVYHGASDSRKDGHAQVLRLPDPGETSNSPPGRGSSRLDCGPNPARCYPHAVQQI